MKARLTIPKTSSFSAAKYRENAYSKKKQLHFIEYSNPS